MRTQLSRNNSGCVWPELLAQEVATLCRRLAVEQQRVMQGEQESILRENEHLRQRLKDMCSSTGQDFVTLNSPKLLEARSPTPWSAKSPKVRPCRGQVELPGINEPDDDGDLVPKPLVAPETELHEHDAMQREQDSISRENERLRQRLKNMHSSAKQGPVTIGSQESLEARSPTPTVRPCRGLIEHPDINDPNEDGALVPKPFVAPDFESHEHIAYHSVGYASATSVNKLPQFGCKNELELLASREAVDHHFLRRAFSRIDHMRAGRIKAEHLAQQMMLASNETRQDLPQRIRDALKAVGDCRELRGPGEAGDAESLSFESFRRIILVQDLESLVGVDAAETLQEVKEFYVTSTTMDLVEEKTRITRQDLEDDIASTKLPSWLEPFVGCVILFNALTLGLSLDIGQDWIGWHVIEGMCTLIFILEVFIRLRYVGWYDHFFGADWSWSLFDIVVVLIAVLDAVFFIFSYGDENSEPMLGKFTIVRLFRLLRITRIVRLLRMKMFKELTLMFHGVVGGLRTLFWAFIFLACLVFIFGVVMRQLSRDEHEDCMTLGSECKGDREAFKVYYETLFSDLFRSMLTVFRCMVGDGANPDGTPIAPLLFDVFGPIFTIAYVIVLCFVWFGVFNLVMAIFVENTLESARLNQKKRSMARRADKVRVAKELSKVVLLICGGTGPQESSQRKPQSSFGRFLRHTEAMTGHPKSSDSEVQGSDGMQMAVTRDTFVQIIDHPAVTNLLEDLEISVANKEKLFDIIDSNGNGALDVSELIEGLMKLRGPADKGDTVGTTLMVRQVQRDLQNLELDIQQWNKLTHANQAVILQQLAQLSHAISLPDASTESSSIPEQPPESLMEL